MIERITRVNKKNYKEQKNIDIDFSLFQGSLPEISLSVENIEVSVEEGFVYRGSFSLDSKNGNAIIGAVVSTNDKVETEISTFRGNHVEIPYYFKGKLVSVGHAFEGDFVLITNGGEYNIPYRFEVVNRQLDTSCGKLSRLEEFVELYRTNPKEAESLFFLPRFEEVFLSDDPKKQRIYHNLMKSRSRKQIMEEFFVSQGLKPAITLSVNCDQIVMDAGKNEAEILLSLDASGYVEGSIHSEKGQVQLSHKNFSSADFADGQLSVVVEKNQNYAVGNDKIVIKTVHQTFEVSVEWWGTLPALSPEQEKESRIKRERAELLHNYLYFRTGSIAFEDFARDSRMALDDLVFLTHDVEWKLYQLHLSLMENGMEEAEQRLKELDDLQEKEAFAKAQANYFLYLKAMYYRTPEAISRAVIEIREFYESGQQKDLAFWMLIYLDRDYVYNKKLQYDTIKQLFEQGINSSLLYFEACDILNDNPGYMSELGSFELNIIRWGVRYGYISLSLAYQYARLALKAKYFHIGVFHLAEKLYRVEPDDRFLQVICSLLIKGNRTDYAYHEYFRLGVAANLKIIGLNEFYIRSMDFKQYERIPQRVLIYFTYSNSLDVKEKAYLYCNILHNKDLYDEVYSAYYSKMQPFVEEQLLKGRINEHLACLYTHFQKEVLEKSDYAKAVCDVLFYKKLVCENPEMIGVYVYIPELDEEQYYPFSSSMCNLEIYNDRTQLYFVDSNEQRFCSGVAYTLEDYLSLEQMPAEWIKKNLANKKLFLNLTGCMDGSIREDHVPVLERLCGQADYADWMKKDAVEQLLVYYGNHQDKQMLSRMLGRIDYSNINPGFRKQLMDYYLEVGMTENALFGIELYGAQIMGAAKRLRLASFGVQHIGEKKDDTILYLCYSAFMRKKHNKDTLNYLMKHFDGEMEDLLLIWERSIKFELDTEDFEKKILRQAMFTSNESSSLYPVFIASYEKNDADEVIGRYLKYLSAKELEGHMVIPDKIHSLIGKEVLAGRINDRETKIHFLYYFAEKTDWYDEIRPVIVHIVEEFLQEEFYLPVYHAYEDWLELPVEYRELTFLTYYGEVAKKAVFYYQIEGEGETVTRHLTEILPGHYLCALRFYRNDHVKYHLEMEDVSLDDSEDLTFETFHYEGKESRFFALNQLKAEADEAENLANYLRYAFFTDEFMQMM